MEKDLLSKLNKPDIKLSKSQKKIADYILANYDKAAFYTAGKLGEATGVSESTVVRFATDLGFDGYPGMRKAMQDMIRNRLTSVQRIEAAREYLLDKNILENVMNSDIETLRQSLVNADKTSFIKAVNSIIDADNIYIFGMRSSTSLANFLGFYLNLLKDNVHIVQDTNVSEACEQIIRIKPSDLFIGITYPRYSSKTAKAMQFAKNAGATVIGITDGDASPFGSIADILLYAKSDMVSFVDSLVAPMSLINALIVAVGTRLGDDLSATFRNLEKIWADNEVYEENND